LWGYLTLLTSGYLHSKSKYNQGIYMVCGVSGRLRVSLIYSFLLVKAKLFCKVLSEGTVLDFVDWNVDWTVGFIQQAFILSYGASAYHSYGSQTLTLLNDWINEWWDKSNNSQLLTPVYLFKINTLYSWYTFSPRRSSNILQTHIHTNTQRHTLLPQELDRPMKRLI
jgi:hypothetical protein